MSYKPRPITTTRIKLSPELRELTERLAKHAHDVWAIQRLKDDWTFGVSRNDDRKEHPCLVPYEKLPESEKQYDRNAAVETIKAVLALGYRIEAPVTSGKKTKTAPATRPAKALPGKRHARAARRKA